MTFRGLMGCACRRECEIKFGGLARRHAPLCWDFGPDVTPARAVKYLNSSDLPDLPGHSLIFRTPAWPPMGRCARPDPPRHCSSGQERPIRRAAINLGGMPLPNARCPLACSRRGTCLRPFKERTTVAAERFPISLGVTAGNADGERVPGCICHHGYSGAGCEIVDIAKCINRCSGHGRCTSRFCLCEPGFQGLDCSLRSPGVPTTPPADDSKGLSTRTAEGGVRYTAADRRHASSTAAPVTASRLPYAPIWMYPLATDFSMEGVYQRDQHRRGQYYANLMFAEQLLARQDSIVSDPEAAALFFVPVMVMQMAGNLWHPYEFLKQTVTHLSHNYPYWNRTAGTDHIFFLTTDRAGCWKPWAVQNSLIITYLGFRGQRRSLSPTSLTRLSSPDRFSAPAHAQPVRALPAPPDSQLTACAMATLSLSPPRSLRGLLWLRRSAQMAAAGPQRPQQCLLLQARLGSAWP